MAAMPDANLLAMLETLDSRLATALAHSRASFQHMGLRGDGSEYAVREVLDSHLPRYLAVGTGEVIDLSDTRSGQVDVIIANEDQPFRTNIHEAGVFLIEGVGAAGEVKSNLTITELKKTLTAAAGFKGLRMQDRGILFMAMKSDQIRFFDCPPYFLFAFESEVAPETLLERLAAADLVNPPDGGGQALSPLDAVFILGQGVAINYGNGQGTLRYQHDSGPHAGEIATGWLWHARDSGIFTYFLLWLSAVMPRFLRISSIASNYLIKAVEQPQ
jgi:hypothetical protein